MSEWPSNHGTATIAYGSIRNALVALHQSEDPADRKRAERAFSLITTGHSDVVAWRIAQTEHAQRTP